MPQRGANSPAAGGGEPAGTIVQIQRRGGLSGVGAAGEDGMEIAVAVDIAEGCRAPLETREIAFFVPAEHAAEKPAAPRQGKCRHHE